MNVLKAYYILVLIVSQQSIALDIIDEATQEINQTRKTTLKITKKTEKAIKAIQEQVTGYKNGINFNKIASCEEIRKEMGSFLSINFHQQNQTNEIPLIFFAKPYMLEERYYSHLSYTTTMYLAANFAAQNKQIYFLTEDQCAISITQKLHTLIDDERTEKGFKKYLKSKNNLKNYVHAILTYTDFLKLVVLYSRGYKDISHQWLIDAADIMRKDLSCNQHNLLNGNYKSRNKLTDKIDFVMVEDSKNCLATILIRYGIASADYCRLHKHTFLRGTDNIVTLLNELDEAKKADSISYRFSPHDQEFKLKNNVILICDPQGFRYGSASSVKEFIAQGKLGDMPLLTNIELNLTMSLRDILECLIQAGIYEFKK